MFIHPPTVHFPIALLLVGSLLELFRPHEPSLLQAARIMLKLGWWFALLAMFTGILRVALNWELAQRQLGLVNGHAITSLLIVGIYWRLVIAYQPMPDNQRKIWLGIGSGLIILTGFLGGRLLQNFLIIFMT